MKLYILFLALLMICLIQRLITVNHSPLILYSDDAIYASFARFWLQGKYNLVFHPTWPPLYPFLSAILARILNIDAVLSLRIMSSFANIFLGLVLYFLATRWLSKLEATLFSLIAVNLTPIIKNSVLALSDILSLLLIFCGIVSFTYSINPGYKKYFILCGMFFGLAFLTRSEGSLFLILSVVFLSGFSFFKFIRNKNLNLLFQEIKKVFILLTTFFLFISPYFFSNYQKTGSLTLSQKFSAQIKQGHAFELRKGSTWSQEVVSVKSPNYKSDYFKGGTSFVIEEYHWFWFWFKQKSMAWLHFFLTIIPLWTIPFIVLGIIYSFRKKNNFFVSLYLLFINISAIPITIFSTAMIDIRYLIWVLPFIILFIFLGIKQVLILLKINIKLMPVPMFLSTLLLPIFTPNYILHPQKLAESVVINYQRIETIKAAEWINLNSAHPNPKIMSRHEGLEYYTNGETIYIPQVDYPGLIKYAKDKNVDFLTAHEQELVADPNLNLLLNQEQNFPELKKVYHFPEENPQILIYTLN